MIPYPTVPPFPGFTPAFIAAQNLYHLQSGQDAANQAAHDKFVQDSANWVVQNTQNRALGLPISQVPQIPQKITYDDNGNIIYGTFTDLTIPALPTETTPGPTMVQVIAANQAANLSDSQKLDSLMLSVQTIMKSLQIK